MNKDRLDIRADGLYSIRDVFGKPLERKVERGWHVLFTDETGMKRLGFVCSIDPGTQRIALMDDVVYPHAPSPIGEPQEVISWSQVLEAGSGFYRPRRIVYTDRKHATRQVWVLNESESTVGFVVSKQHGIRFYVDCLSLKDRMWEVR